MKQKAFISYRRATRDIEFAEGLRLKLHDWGLDTWMDIHDLAKGDYWPDAIDRALQECSIVIGVVSEAAVESRNVKNEWYWSLDHDKPFIPILLEKIVNLPHRLSSINLIDFTKGEKTGIQALQDALTSSPPVQEKLERNQSSLATKRSAKSENDLLRKVRSSWIDGVLNSILGGGVGFEMSLETAPQAVLQHVDYGEYTLPSTFGIAQVFEDLSRELLILGAPGSGKTTLMLQLAQRLLLQAEEDAAQPIPVVFNLSSWAIGCKSLASWLVDELGEKYQIGKRDAQKLVDFERLVLLLDGLDEVSQEYREQCVEAINAYRIEYRSTDMVVCSRITDYDLLANKLNLQGAMLLSPLSQQQIDEFLAPEPYAGLREALTTDSHLQEMSKNPFLLNAMTVAYRGASAVRIKLPTGQDTLDGHRDHLLENYVQRRIENGSRYSPKQTRRYLIWLAQTLDARKETILNKETLQPFDLRSSDQLRTYQRMIDFVFGGFFALYGFVTVTAPLFLSIFSSKGNLSQLLQLLPLWIVSLGLPSAAAFILSRRFSTGLSRVTSQQFAKAIAFAASFTVSSILTYSLLIVSLVTYYLYYVTYVDPALAKPVLSEVNHWLALIYYSGAYLITENLAPIYIIVCGTLAAYIGLYVGKGDTVALGREDKLVPSLRFPIFRGAWQQFKASYMAYERHLMQSPTRRRTLFSTILLFGILGVLTAYNANKRLSASIGDYALMFIAGVIFGTIVVSLSVIVAGTIRGMGAVMMKDTLKPIRMVTKQLRRSLLNSTRMAIFYTLIFAVVAAVLTWNSAASQRQGFLLQTLSYLPYTAWIFGIPAFIVGGGSAILQYLVIRYVLLRRDYVPFNYARFLKSAADANLLREVGTGYIFFHRYLLDYFAKQSIS